MESSFKKGQDVTVRLNSGVTLDGKVLDWDYNICTFEKEYSVEYFGMDGNLWTMIGVPERALTSKTIEQ